jgi:uncharacterized cupredoxin-like copper-binding protein
MTKPRTRRTRTVLCAALLCGLGGSVALAAGSHGAGHGHAMAFGQPGDPDKAVRTVEIVLLDTEFNVPHLHVKDGETVRFVVRNAGELVHEFNIGTPGMHRSHQAEMTKMMERGMIDAVSVRDHAMDGAHMPMKHDDPNSVLLEPGESAELTWTFKKVDGLEFACNLPGHYQVGMVGSIEVTG